MTTKSILLAIPDPQLSDEFAQVLGDKWEATSVASDSEAFEQLEKGSFDAMVVDFNLGSPDASDLLNQAMDKRPQMIRFLLAYEADLALVAAKVLGSPQILPKPIEPAALKSRVENGINDSESKQSESEPVSGSNEAPIIPAIYADVLKAIESPGIADEQVGRIIAQDAALSSEVLRLTNSTYLGLPRNVSGPVEAVEALGLEVVKALVMCLQFLAEHSRLKPGYLSLDQLWQHSVQVGQIARDLVLFETKDRTLASQALIAGLIHDFGKVILVTNFDDLYGRVNSLARKQPVSLWDVEKEMFGANHGEIGACLAGMWNLPSAIVDAAAFHHEPSLSEHQQFTPMAAIHIANVLQRELGERDDDMMVAPIIDTTFLNQVGLLQRLPVWRAAFANRGLEILELEQGPIETAQSATTMFSKTPTSRTANQLPGPVVSTQTSTSRPVRSGDEAQAGHAVRHYRSWVFAGIAALLILLTFWFKTQLEPDQGEPVYARTPAAQPAPVVVSVTPSPEPTTVPTEQPARTVAVSPEPPAPIAPAESVAEAPTSTPAPEPASSTNAPSPTLTSVAPPNVAPEAKPLPEFHLNGIIYTKVNPSAIVNGQTVKLGDMVNGARVVGIGPTAVTLQIKGRRKTYELQ